MSEYLGTAFDHLADMCLTLWPEVLAGGGVWESEQSTRGPWLEMTLPFAVIITKDARYTDQFGMTSDSCILGTTIVYVADCAGKVASLRKKIEALRDYLLSLQMPFRVTTTVANGSTTIPIYAAPHAVRKDRQIVFQTTPSQTVVVTVDENLSKGAVSLKVKASWEGTDDIGAQDYGRLLNGFVVLSVDSMGWNRDVPGNALFQSRNLPQRAVAISASLLVGRTGWELGSL